MKRFDMAQTNPADNSPVRFCVLDSHRYYMSGWYDLESDALIVHAWMNEAHEDNRLLSPRFGDGV